MLDEELEIEQKTIKKDDLTSNGRYMIDYYCSMFIYLFFFCWHYFRHIINNVPFCNLFVIFCPGWALPPPHPAKKKKKKKKEEERKKRGRFCHYKEGGD